jgi:hypothetical protein
MHTQDEERTQHRDADGAWEDAEGSWEDQSGSWDGEDEDGGDE